MDKLILLAPVITASFLLWRGFAWTFSYWYLPLMLLVPAFLTMDGPGIPPLAFYTAGFLPFFLNRDFWRTAITDAHWVDGFVYLFIAVACLSELVNLHFASARQVLFLQALTLWGPYIAMRRVILEGPSEFGVARAITIAMALIGIYGLYTFRFGVNHFLILRNIWPYFASLPGLAVWPRWGFFRAAGPFMHPITAGIAFGFAMPLALWLWRSRARPQRWLDLGTLAATAIGVATTLSRGPVIGALAAVAFYLMGESRNRVLLFGATGALLLFLSVPGSFKIAEYFDATRNTATSVEQETAIYRRDLLLNYIEVVKKKPWLGYSFTLVPVIEDQNSIDNGYLFVALEWGVIAVFAMLMTMLGPIFAMIWLGTRQDLDPVQRGQAWALCGALLGCAFSATTVALVPPVTTIMALFAGWATALMVRHRRGLYDEEASLIDPLEGEADSAAVVAQAPPGLKIL